MASRGYVKPKKVKQRLARRIKQYDNLVSQSRGNTSGYRKPGSKQGA